MARTSEISKKQMKTLRIDQMRFNNTTTASVDEIKYRMKEDKERHI